MSFGIWVVCFHVHELARRAVRIAASCPARHAHFSTTHYFLNP
jgi:hypothetical protein